MSKIKVENSSLMGMMFSIQNGGYWLKNNGYKAQQIFESYPSYFEIAKENLSDKMIKLTPRGEKRLEQLMSAGVK